MKRRKKLSNDEALYLYNKALVTYDETIHECIKILMAESPWKGIPLLLGRNPEAIPPEGGKCQWECIISP